MSDLVRVIMADGVAVITIARPEKHNAFIQEIREALADALESAERDSSCRGIILAGAGRHFSSGGDPDAFVSMSAADLPILLSAAHRCIRAIRRAGKPVVAAVEGHAAGGAVGLILACDAVVAARDAKIAFPFLKLGLVPDWGCAYLLQEKVGSGHARRLLLRASTLSGAEAYAIGVIDELCESGAAIQAANHLIHTFLALPGDAWALTKGMLGASEQELDKALQLECEHQQACFASSAFRSALDTLLARRANNSTHRL